MVRISALSVMVFCTGFSSLPCRMLRERVKDEAAPGNLSALHAAARAWALLRCWDIPWSLQSGYPGKPLSQGRRVRKIRAFGIPMVFAQGMSWAQGLKRVFAIDIEICRQCGGRLRVIASIEEPAVIERILKHLGREAVPVDPAHPSRAPPRSDRLI